MSQGKVSGAPPMYSLPAPLYGILVDTMLTKTPILSALWLILYDAQLVRFRAVLVMTSEPPCVQTLRNSEKHVYGSI